METCIELQSISSNAFVYTIYRIGLVAGFEEELATASRDEVFIDRMSLGRFTVVDADGSVVAGSLEGLVAQLIQVRQPPLSSAANILNELSEKK